MPVASLWSFGGLLPNPKPNPKGAPLDARREAWLTWSAREGRVTLPMLSAQLSHMGYIVNDATCTEILGIYGDTIEGGGHQLR